MPVALRFDSDLLAAICLFVNGSKGMSSVQFSRDLDVQYKTAWVLAHKLREALGTKVHTGEEMENKNVWKLTRNIN